MKTIIEYIAGGRRIEHRMPDDVAEFVFAVARRSTSKMSISKIIGILETDNMINKSDVTSTTVGPGRSLPNEVHGIWVEEIISQDQLDELTLARTEITYRPEAARRLPA